MYVRVDWINSIGTFASLTTASKLVVVGAGAPPPKSTGTPPASGTAPGIGWGDTKPAPKENLANAGAAITG